MKGEVSERDFNVELRSEAFNTHGTDIAPGSDVIGEDFEFGTSHGQCEPFGIFYVSSIGAPEGHYQRTAGQCNPEPKATGAWRQKETKNCPLEVCLSQVSGR